MKTLIAAAVLLAFAAPAHAADPYQEGLRDYRRGLCFQARPYGGPPFTSDEELKAALWTAGYDDAASARDKKYRGRRYIEWPPKCHGPGNP